MRVCVRTYKLSFIFCVYSVAGANSGIQRISTNCPNQYNNIYISFHTLDFTAFYNLFFLKFILYIM